MAVAVAVAGVATWYMGGRCGSSTPRLSQNTSQGAVRFPRQRPPPPPTPPHPLGGEFLALALIKQSSLPMPPPPRIPSAPPGDEFLAQALRAVSLKLPLFTPQGISNLLWGLARLGWLPEAGEGAEGARARAQAVVLQLLQVSRLISEHHIHIIAALSLSLEGPHPKTLNL